MDTRTPCLGAAKVALILAMTLATRGLAEIKIKTDSGVVEGMTDSASGLHTFKGIPYAAPPVGDLRWKEPQPAVPWSGVLEATAFGPRPMQANIYSDMIFRDAGPSEDCLTLNVWTPAHEAKQHLPVMVWIYGGGFQAGGTSEPRQDGTNLAKKGVVVVSMNYRLGVFGLLAHPDLTKESGHGASGNYGLMDQAAALRWVNRNIAAFGGDPGNVTIFGESAGSYSVSLQMASPLARGLFQRAIGESGSLLGTERNPAHILSLAEGEKEGVAFAASFGAKSIAALRAIPAADILKASRDQKLGDRVVVDGYFLPKSGRDIYAAGEQAQVPLLAGWNADESRVYSTFGSNRPTAKTYEADVRKEYGSLADDVLYLYPAGSDAEALKSKGDLAGDRFIISSTWKWIEMQLRTGNSPVYRYQFDRAVPVTPGFIVNGSPATAADVGAAHASEIPYVFGALDSKGPGVQWEDGDRKLSDLMETYWSNFAKTGNPNAPGLPEWPRYDGASGYPVMHLDVVSKAAPEARRDRQLFWDGAPARP